MARISKPADSVCWLKALVEPGRSVAATGVVLRLPGGVSLELTSRQVYCVADPGIGEAMLSFSGSLRVFVAVEAFDKRKGFNGLNVLVAERLGEDLKSDALFVFGNRRHTRLKII